MTTLSTSTSVEQTSDKSAMVAQSYGKTYNGAPTYVSSSKALLDLFAMVGSARNNRVDAFKLYEQAVLEDRLNSYKLLFWLRDCRGGAAEKTTFHILFAKELRELYQAGKREMFDALLKLIPVYGYWKDLLVVAQMESQSAEWVFDFLASELKKMEAGTSSLLAKYMPRPRGGKTKKLAISKAMAEAQAQAEVKAKAKAKAQAKAEAQAEAEAEAEVEAQAEAEAKSEAEVEAQAELVENEDELVGDDECVNYPSMPKAIHKNKASNLVFEKQVVDAMCQRLGLSQGAYRKLLVSHTQVVEHMMTAKQWNKIDYSSLPSAALMLYKEAFRKKDKHRYLSFIKRLSQSSPDEKLMNNTHMLPHELAYYYTQNRINEKEFDAYWNQLKSYDGLNGIMVMVDTSGSMESGIYGSKYRPIDVSIGLGLYVANKQEGPFKNQMLVFSSYVQWLNFSEEQSPSKMLQAIPRIVENTDFALAYQKILEYAQSNKVAAKDMPKALMVFSDMEFDQADTGKVAFEDMKQLFNTAGYELPKIVFWNLNGRGDNIQVKADTPNTFLISGFSTSILKNFIETGLEAFSINPFEFMNEVLGAERYQPVQDALISFLPVAN